MTASVSCDIAGYTVSGGCPANDQVQLSAFGPATVSACNANVSPWSPSAYSSVAGSKSLVIRYTVLAADVLNGSNARTATCTVTVSIKSRGKDKPTTRVTLHGYRSFKISRVSAF